VGGRDGVAMGYDGLRDQRASGNRGRLFNARRAFRCRRAVAPTMRSNGRAGYITRTDWITAQDCRSTWIRTSALVAA
jgi:hypothetical protein